MFSPEFCRLLIQIFQGQQLLPPVQPPLGEDPQITMLVSEVATMQQDIEDATARCTSFEFSLTTLQSESESLLARDATPAMDALLVLVNRIEYLHRFTQDQRTSALITYRDPTSAFGAIQARMPLVNACKSQSRTVFDHFQSLSAKARSLTEEFTELATDITFEIAMAQERIERLEHIVAIAETLRNGVENQRQIWHGQKVAAEAHVEQARETVQSAQRKRDSAESARVVRNLLTFGIGEAFDFFNLNEEIEDAERTVASAQQNVRANEQSIQRALAALQQINDEVARLNVLGDTVCTQGTTLQESMTHGQALRTRTINLTNASLDISLFVGTLAARSETFAVHHTAQEFAQSILSLGRLMMSEGTLNGLLMERDPGALQETLNMIAQSDSEDSVAGNDRSIGTGWQQHAIEDMM